MSINIDSVLNNISQNYTTSNTKKSSSNVVITDNIFAQASALVAEAKAKQEELKNSNSESSNKGLLGSLGFANVANMSTNEFLNYAYENKATSGYSDSKEDSSGVKLPMIANYHGKIVSTSGKSFMAVVAKFKAMFPTKSEEKIAAELMAKYGNSTATSGSTINMSA